MQINTSDSLNYAVSQGIIDLSYVRDRVEMAKREEYLNKHPYKIWCSKDGKWYTYLPDGERGRVLKKRASKKGIEDLIVEYWKADTENPTIEEVFDEYNDRRLRLRQISKSTHSRNRQYFERHYGKFGKHRIKSVSAEDFTEFLEEQIPQYDLTAKAFNNLKSITKGFLRRAKKRGLISFDVNDMLEDIEISQNAFNKIVKEDEKEVFTDAELDVLLKYLIEHQDIWNLGILLLFATGMRIGELVALKWCDFSPELVKVRRTETCYRDEFGEWVHEVKDFPKTSAGVRNIVIPSDFRWLYEAIQKYNKTDEFVFSRNGKRMRENCIRSRLWRLCGKLGIVRKSPHKIRKTYGTILLDNNVDQRLIIDQMGHTNISVTEEYYHKNRRTSEVKARIISDIPQFQLNQIACNQV